MKFSHLSKIFQKIEETSKRLEKTAIIATELESLKENEDISEFILLLQGIVFPIFEGKKLGFAQKTIFKTIAHAYGISETVVQETNNTLGDVGLLAEELQKKKTQQTLFGFEQETLQVKQVIQSLQKLHIEEGNASTNRKISHITALLSKASPLEAKYIVRLISGDLRIGISTGTIRDAVIKTYLPTIKNLLDETDKEKQRKDSEKITLTNAKNCVDKTYIELETYEEAREVYIEFVNTFQRALDKNNDLSTVALIAKEKGIVGLRKVTLEVLKPCRVMLMQKVTTLPEGIQKIPLPLALEYKYDGFRGLVHKKNSEIKIFTRNLEDVSTQFPDLVLELQKNIIAKEVIIDGEILGISKEGKVLPFQEVSQRIKRKHNIEEMSKKLPVIYTTWDILYKDGEELLNLPMNKRREVLIETIASSDKISISNQKIITTQEEGEIYYQKSLQEGNEGVVLKDLQGIYQPGNRVGCWLKLKPIMDPLDVVILSAEWGEGKRAKWLTSFTVAVSSAKGLVAVGKVGTGFKELENDNGVTFAEMTTRLLPLVIKTEKNQVFVKPEVCLSVHFEEIQKSSSYESGFALRFPRILSIRDDINIDEIDSLERITEEFKKQHN